jgi:hypothetical protein
MPHVPNPTVDLCVLADLKEFLGIPTANTTNDDLLQMLLTAESDYIQQWCNRRLVSQSFTERRDGSGSDTLFFRQYPATAVTSVQVYDVNIPFAPNFNSPVSVTGQGFWGQAGYPAGYFYTNRKLMARYGSWPAGTGNVALTYTAGFVLGTNMPLALTQAALELAAFRYKQKDKLLTGGGQSIDGQSVQFGGTGRTGLGGATMGEMPDYVRSLIQRYRRVTQILQSEE